MFRVRRALCPPLTLPLLRLRRSLCPKTLVSQSDHARCCRCLSFQAAHCGPVISLSVNRLPSSLPVVVCESGGMKQDVQAYMKYAPIFPGPNTNSPPSKAGSLSGIE
jgi:hypothetical protein